MRYGRKLELVYVQHQIHPRTPIAPLQLLKEQTVRKIRLTEGAVHDFPGQNQGQYLEKVRDD